MISGRTEIEDGNQWWIVWYSTDVGVKGRHRDSVGDEQIAMIPEVYGGELCADGKILFECMSARVSKSTHQDKLVEDIDEWGVTDGG